MNFGEMEKNRKKAMTDELREKIEERIYCLQSDIDYWTNKAESDDEIYQIYDEMTGRRYAIQVLTELLK